MPALPSDRSEIRPMRRDDWIPATIEPGKYSNAAPLRGFRRRDGQGGNPLHPASEDEGFEEELARRLAVLREGCPGAIAERYSVTMPYWRGEALPQIDDYPFASQPRALTTTSVTVVLVPNGAGTGQEMGFYFRGRALPTLRERQEGDGFRGLVGNLGYFMTGALVESYPWAHNVRYPEFPLRAMPSYIGFHLFRDERDGEVHSSFMGAHPGAVGIRWDGPVEVLPRLETGRYEVVFGRGAGSRVVVEAVDQVEDADGVALFTPAFRGTDEIQRLIAATEDSGGADDEWQRCRPLIPVAAGEDRVNVFVTNEGNGRFPVEKVVAVWPGSAPLPSFGAVLSFDRRRFRALFGSVDRFRDEYLGKAIQILPGAANVDLEPYAQIMGGLVPAVVDGEHVYAEAETVGETMRLLGRFGATSPIAQCSRETRNFDPRIREPAGVFLQTEHRAGWVLFDGRHELSTGASVVDVALMLRKLEGEGLLGGRIKQALFVDGGSAMKAYHVRREDGAARLELLNRVAAGSRNGPGADPEGLNLYATLKLGLDSQRI